VKVVILAGGYGTRLMDETVTRPKPMVEIGGRPILWHIMKTYAARGFKEFVVALGYKGEFIKTYFLDEYRTQGSLSVNLATGHVDYHENVKSDWLVHLIDAGLGTGTGGRLKRLRNILDGETFMMTYGDGLADLDADSLLEFHRGHGKLATVTAVRAPARFGVIEMGDKSSRVYAFAEKSNLSEGWINGGFFVLEPSVFDYLEDDDAHAFEYLPMQRLAADGQLYAYRHEGFWQCMDTLRDVRYLEELWTAEKPPWKNWDD
jgi:glucose-1-phosphate cytidylyltransferase